MRPPLGRSAVVLVAALVLAGLVALFARHVLRAADVPTVDEPPGRTGLDDEAPTLAPRGAREVAEETTAVPSASLEPLTAAPLPAGTRFQQRLALGEELRGIQGRMEAGEIAPEAVLPRVRRQNLAGRLALDAWREGLRMADRAGTERQAAEMLLAWMVEPSRDTISLLRHPAETEESVLRVWTRADPFPPVDLEAGEALLRRLQRVAGDTSPYGYDVVATPDMGAEIFPHAPLFAFGPPAAGLYSTADDLCLIRTVYARRFQRILLKHELVHAYAIRQRGLWKSRFLEEGLAEYVSRWLPEDERLEVPLRRFANEFAALLAITSRQRAYGLGVSSMSFVRLLRLSPFELYGLGRMGYLLAQAAVAYAGADAVEAALRDRHDGPLRSVVESLTWPKLAMFLAEHAAGGRAENAMVIDDLGPGDASRGAVRIRRAWRSRAGLALRMIGVSVPEGFGDRAARELMELPASVVAQDAERLRDVLRGIGSAAGGPVVFVAEATEALDDPLRWTDETLPQLATLVGAPEGIRTAADLVDRLHAGLRSGEEKADPVVLAWNAKIEPDELPLDRHPGPVQTSDLVRHLARLADAPALLVVCLASRDGGRAQMREILARSRSVDASEVPDATVAQGLQHILAAYARKMPTAPTRVLVVDLADGAGDAQMVANVFADALGGRSPVALWNPQRPVR